MSRNFQQSRNVWDRHAVAYGLPDALGELSGDFRRHGLTQGELKALFSRLVPAAILVAGYREFPGGEIETVDLDVRPALVEFGGTELHAILVDQQSSGNGFLREPMPLRPR